MKLYDTRDKTLEDVVIKGHEFRETSFYYPTLKGDEDKVSDIHSIDRIEDFLIMQCYDRRLKEKQSSILILDIKNSIFNRIKNT